MKINYKIIVTGKDNLIKKLNNVDPKKYLSSGTRTMITDNILNLTKSILDNKTLSDGKKLKILHELMNSKTKRLKNSRNDFRKFKRSAEEILQSKERTGCCDSSTLFTALCRSIGIPAVQIITYKDNEDGKKGSSGHFFTAVYITDSDNNKCWNIIDSDNPEIKIKILDENCTAFNNGYIPFAFVHDYYDDLDIDSIPKMLEVQSTLYNYINNKSK